MSCRKFTTKKQLVKVTFSDPADYDNRFKEKFEPVKCCAVGWLMKETASCLKLVWLLDEDDGPSAGIAIPKGTVISVEAQ